MPVYKDKTHKGTTPWYTKFTYTDTDGKKKSKLKRGFATRKDAEYYEEQFIKSAGKEREYQFEEVVKFYLEQRGHKSKLSTMTTKESIINNYILPEFKGKDIREIHKRDLMRWQSKYLFAKNENGERKLKDTYIKTINCQLRAIFNFAKMSDFIEYNPVTDLEAVGKKNSDRKYIVWSADDMKLFLSSITDYEVAYLAFNILLYTGIRKGELLALTLSDFTYENKTLNIDKTFSVIKGKEVITTPKTESSIREVPLPSFLCDEIQSYIDLLYEPDDSERIFKYKSGSFLVDAMEVGCKRTGLPKIRIHDTRHSHITMLASLLIPNKEIAERVGQKGNNMVIHYSHSTSIEQKNIVDILERERGDD